MPVRRLIFGWGLGSLVNPVGSNFISVLYEFLYEKDVTFPYNIKFTIGSRFMAL